MPLVPHLPLPDAQAAGQERRPAPHFVCMGAQKAGTQWLYDQAASHPDVWMPPVKELRFLGGRWQLAREDALRMFNVALQQSWRGTDVDLRDLEFLRRMCFDTTEDDAGDFEAYRHLFEVAGSSMTGDVSPQYSLIGRNGIVRVLEGLPEARFLYMVREPVSRVWSQVCMQFNWSEIPAPRLASRLGTVPPEVVTDPKVLADYIRIPGVVNHSFQSRVIERWSSLAGDRFAAYLMDDLIALPAEFRRMVFAHIGLDGDRCTVAADHNKKELRRRFELTPPLRNVIEEYLGEETVALRELVSSGAITAMPGNAQQVRWWSR